MNLPCLRHFIKVVRNVEQNIFHALGFPLPKGFAIAGVNDKKMTVGKFSIKDIVGNGFLLAVPKFRRTIEKRWKRKYGDPKYILKIIVPKTNILVCQDCGHHYEAGRLCAHCYQKVEAETKAIQEKICLQLGKNKPIENDVIVLYDGEQLTEKPEEFWQGKRIIEMKKERPQWFSKNLLQKTTKQTSDSTDVKPTDLA